MDEKNPKELKTIKLRMKFKFQRRVKGSIMGLVLTISMLVTVLSSFFILRGSLDSQAYLIYENNDRLINNAKSGLELLLSPSDFIKPESFSTIDLFEEGNDSIYLERKSWGAFEIVISKAFKWSRFVSRKAMLGARPADSIPLTLYVADLQKPISVCGNTKLVGKCYVSPAGFKRAYIEGQNYSGDKYVYGLQLPSQRNMPELNKELVTVLQNQLKMPISNYDSIIRLEQVEDTLINSFDNKTIVIQSSGILNINNLVLKGNIKLIAPEVKISSNCVIENLLIITSKLEVDDSFTGEFQAIANERIIIGKEVKLNYPSILAMIPKSANGQVSDEPQIYIGEKSELTADIICFNEKNTDEQEPYVSIDKEAIINGNVYVAGKLDIKGKIYGSTYCNRFYLKTNSGVYENHLLNAELDASKLPKHYIGTQLIKNGSRREVIAWL